MGENDNTLLESAAQTNLASTSVLFARLLAHARKPENLIVYLVFTAWAKYMEIWAELPSVTIG